MKQFLIRCAIAGAIIGGAAAASFSAVSSSMSNGLAIGSSSTRTGTAVAAQAAAAPAAPAAPAAVSQPASAPAAGSPPNPSNAQGCVGGAVSTAAHIEQSLGEGFGDAFKDGGFGTPGAAIQSFAQATCGKH